MSILTSHIDQLQQEVIEEFDFFDDWMGKYEYLIDLGKQLPLIANQYKTEEYEIKGCQSKVWLNAELQGDRVSFTADSDALITKGIIALLIRVLNQQSPQAIAQADLYMIEKIGLKAHLSPNRSNGLMHMIRQLKTYGVLMQTTK